MVLYLPQQNYIFISKSCDQYIMSDIYGFSKSCGQYIMSDIYGFSRSVFRRIPDVAVSQKQIVRPKSVLQNLESVMSSVIC